MAFGDGFWAQKINEVVIKVRHYVQPFQTDTDREMDRGTDGRMDGWTERRMDRSKISVSRHGITLTRDKAIRTF